MCQGREGETETERPGGGRTKVPAAVAAAGGGAGSVWHTHRRSHSPQHVLLFVYKVKIS